MTLSMLQEGKVMTSTLGISYRILKLLGSGGQGEVYEVTAGNKHYALKWYHPHMATPKQEETLVRLVHNGKPDERFLWPMDFIKTSETFGYIMALRPNVYKSIVNLMKRKAEPTFKALCRAGYELADCFQKLHSLGYSYCDISFGNAFIRPDTGEVLVCDNDNVVINGASADSVQGTLGFMAPEIVRGEKGPTTETDLFSLAVLLFYMFMLHHPLEGATEASIKCLDIRAKEVLYGQKPVFIWDPTDLSNRPIAGYQDNAIIYWRLYPDFIKDLFIVAFTEGIHTPSKRIVENQWKRGFKRLEDSIVHCLHCGAENFYEDKSHLGVSSICWCCNQIVEAGAVLLLGQRAIVLNPETIIYAHHFYQDFDFDTEIARVIRHPQDPNKWGVQNRSTKSWQVTTLEGSSRVVAPGKSMTLLTGTVIDFGISNTLGFIK